MLQRSKDSDGKILDRGIRFINLQNNYMKKGYSEEKAFSLANEQFVTEHAEANMDSKILTDYAEEKGFESFYSQASIRAVILLLP
jgi:hypothetical protein